MTWSKCPRCQWWSRFGDSRNACGCSCVAAQRSQSRSSPLKHSSGPPASSAFGWGFGSSGGRWPALRQPTHNTSTFRPCALCATAAASRTRPLVAPADPVPPHVLSLYEKPSQPIDHHGNLLLCPYRQPIRQMLPWMVPATMSNPSLLTWFPWPLHSSSQKSFASSAPCRTVSCWRDPPWRFLLFRASPTWKQRWQAANLLDNYQVLAK